MTFKAYLATRRYSADPTGDLARLASADSFPDISTIEELKDYVFAYHGSGPLSDAVPSLWKAYHIAARKH